MNRFLDVGVIFPTFVNPVLDLLGQGGVGEVEEIISHQTGGDVVHLFIHVSGHLDFED